MYPVTRIRNVVDDEGNPVELTGAVKVDTILLTSNNWKQNNSTSYYEYDVKDATITKKHLVDGRLDFYNSKLKDGYIESYDGGFKVITTELPAEDITMEITIQETISKEG